MRYFAQSGEQILSECDNGTLKTLWELWCFNGALGIISYITVIREMNQHCIQSDVFKETESDHHWRPFWKS